MKTAWTAEPAHELLDLPGAGLCVPDLVFTHADTGRRVYFEALGYWSREAVWRRVELVEAGLPQPIIFALSRRLRVSEEALDENLPGQLYVYAGVISPGAQRHRAQLHAGERPRQRPAPTATSRPRRSAPPSRRG